MASFYAELLVEGNTYRVVHCSYLCHQDTDARGRVQAKVRHAPLELTLDVPDDDQLLAWANAPHKPLAGQVVFYDATQRIAHETIAFAAGECVQYAEQFASGTDSDGAYVCQLTITAPSFELRAGGPVAAVMASADTAIAATTARTGLVDAATSVPSAVATAITSFPIHNPTPASEYTLDEFTKTIGGAEHVEPALIAQLYHLFNTASQASAPGKPSVPDWKALETLLCNTHYTDPKDGNAKPLNGHWPPANGGYQRQTIPLKQGDLFDRFQGGMVDTKPDPNDSTKRIPLAAGDEFDVTFIGNFVSPMGLDGAPQSFESRALDRPKEHYPFAYTVEVLHDVPLEVVSGELAQVIPWYGQSGGGTQMRLSFQDPGWYRQEWQQMQTQGYARLTLTSSPSSEYEVLSPTSAKKRTS